MKKCSLFIILSSLCVFLSALQAEAFTTGDGFLCVNNIADPTNDLQLALDSVTAANNEVRLRGRGEGENWTYPISDEAANGHFNIATNHSLTISGGWNADCTEQTHDPQLTVLQGGVTQQDVGGVLYVLIYSNTETATLSISNLTFKNGSSYFEGGGLYIEHTFLGEAATLLNVEIADVIAENNSAFIFGSGISIFDRGTAGGMNISIVDCIVQNNSVPEGSDGGPAGILIDNLRTTAGVSVIIKGCQILNNVAEIGGGGLYIDTGPGDAILVNNVIAGNRAKDYGAGVNLANNITPDGGTYTLINNTITGNTNTNPAVNYRNGGGIYAEFDNPASTINFYNNIIYGNSAPGDGDDIYIENEGVQVNLYNNDFDNSIPAGFFVLETNNLSSASNLNIDPLFLCSASDNYHLTSSSPVIDQGSNTAPFVPADDLDGLTRPYNTIVDMGAYEFQPGSYQILPGDVNDDQEITLHDALLGVQVMTGLTPDEPVCKNADVNNDGAIGAEDILFILQEVSGLGK